MKLNIEVGHEKVFADVGNIYTLFIIVDGYRYDSEEYYCTEEEALEMVCSTKRNLGIE